MKCDKCDNEARFAIRCGYPDDLVSMTIYWQGTTRFACDDHVTTIEDNRHSVGAKTTRFILAAELTDALQDRIHGKLAA